ncbi:NAD(P)-dependent dehydrogenase (short-subunit alcohol dehydrogenase family) [Kitasatospora sp. MAP12-15]|uniref:SDR family NAD(P)-dependent oxidoreductase n=1 Tax=unclassified Kitasatospora TaxID=2633591 RepID=UPI00247682B4|nr:SDR family oxidoreductase [Kitasatospora sp. MAP12-44]MDH6114725.1 NAD(P)-dependent dehydrogenase (short-subunit alcohol dehydrogenase family) [Kitasatospora sp. MAP12-44]
MPRPVTIVTGGSRGIGAAVCRRLAADGHDLAVGYLRDAGSAEQVAEDARALGARAVTVQLDTALEADVDRLFDTAAEQLGPVANLVNNAGVTGPLAPITELRAEDLRRVVDVNLIGYVLCARRAARDFTRGGAIVNISSAAATLGSPGEYVHYAATKAATDALTVGLAKELGPAGIRVNTVSPGLTNTEMHRDMGDADRPTRLAPGIPLRRAGEPAEIASAVAWLLSPDAAYATGANLRISGGL